MINQDPSSAACRGVLFDLYGTLVKASERPFSRGLPTALGIGRREWVALLRESLLTRAFESDAAFADFVARSLAPSRAADAARTCSALIQAECAAVNIVPGARSLLAFLKRRGFKLGVVSNLASPFKAAVTALGLADTLETAVYSCDEGMAKPDPEIYRRALQRLDLPPEQVLFVGDSLRNDIDAPNEAGMRTAGVGVSGRDLLLGTVADLGLYDLSADPFRRLLGAGDLIEVGHVHGAVSLVEPPADDEQGRYNLVFRCAVDTESGIETIYAKRFLLPETVHVEAFAYQLQALTGLSACTATIWPAREDLLLVTAAPGRKWEQDLTPETAYELGGHFVFALLFSNADIRPRNAFVGGGSGVTLVDLEHCFFNLAIDTQGLTAPERPETFNTMSPGELAARTKKKVLSARATSRARRSFFTDTPKGSPIDEAFHEGFIDFYERQQARMDDLVSALLARVRADPPLVIGTHGYRRALAEVDVVDIQTRLAMNPQAAYEATW